MKPLLLAVTLVATAFGAFAAPKAIYVDAQGKPHYNHLHKYDSILEVMHNEQWVHSKVDSIDKNIELVIRKRNEVKAWAEAAKVVMDEKCDSFFGGGCKGATKRYNEYVKHTDLYEKDLAMLNKAKADNLAVYDAYVKAEEAAKAAQEELRLAEAKAKAEQEAKAELERAARQARYEAEQERQRIAAQKRHDARVAEINAKKATMTESQIKAREKAVHQEYRKECFNSGNQYRDSGMRLGREYKRLINNMTYKYTGEGYDRADAKAMAIEAYAGVYEDVQRQYKMARQQEEYCHKQKLFWKF